MIGALGSRVSVTSRRVWQYYRRRGLRDLVVRLGAEAHKAASDRGRVILPVGIEERKARTILGALNTPRDGAIEAGSTVLVSGWARSRMPITSVELYVDTNHVGSLPRDVRRLDIQRLHRGLPDAELSGFSTVLRADQIPFGHHQIVVAVTDEAGACRVLSRSFQTVSRETAYDSYHRSTLTTPSEAARLAADGRAAGGFPAVDLWVDATGADADVAATVASIDQQDGSWTCTLVALPPFADRLQAQIEGGRLGGRGRLAIAERITIDPSPAPGPRYAGFLRSGETLAPHALAQLMARASGAAPAIVYSDHDHLHGGQRHVDPCFAPDWSPDHLLGRDYVGGFFLARESDDLRRLVESGLDTRGAAWRYDLLLKLTDQTRTVAHVPRVLWSAPLSDDTGRLASGEFQAVEEAIRRRAESAIVVQGIGPDTRRVRWAVTRTPKVSIVIATTGKVQYVRPCLESIRRLTSYPNYELVFLDNSRGRHPEGIKLIRDSGATVIERDEAFNWAKLNNDGARLTDGEVLLFLNDDIEVIAAEWLTELVSQATRPGIGTVGALLTYPNGSIQHAGVVLVGYGGGAMHVLRGMDPADPLHLDLTSVVREVSANTGACLVVQRAIFEEVGGFDERLAVAGNDVDLCLRLSLRGYRNLWTPYCRLIHHESVSRGHIDIAADEGALWARWSTELRRGDPYFNPNFAQDRTDAVIDINRIEKLAEPSKALRVPGGVNLIGYIRAEMGLGEAIRGEALALHDAGVPFAVIDYRAGNPGRMGDQSWAHKTTDQPIYDVNILHLNADALHQAVGRLGHDVLAGRYNIGFWVWELPELPDAWTTAFRYVDEVWVPSRFVLEAVSAKAQVPVSRVPHVVRPPQPPFRSRSELGIPADAYLFLTMYDFHSTRARKNPDGVIDAFQRSFAGDDRTVGLIIKINSAEPREVRSLQSKTGGWANIQILDRIMSRHEVDSLHAAADCFVSLHRAEGFGIPIAEAMAHGKPVIATNWSGNTDFMNETNAACVRYSLVRLQKDEGPYAAGQTWAEPDLDHASSWMHALRQDPARGHALGAVATKSVEHDLSAHAVGQTIRDRLDVIHALIKAGVN